MYKILAPSGLGKPPDYQVSHKEVVGVVDGTFRVEIYTAAGVKCLESL